MQLCLPSQLSIQSVITIGIILINCKPPEGGNEVRARACLYELATYMHMIIEYHDCLRKTINDRGEYYHRASSVIEVSPN